MPYGKVTVQRLEGKIIIVIDPPARGEPSLRGRAENLVDPARWIEYDSSDEHLAVKMTVCRPLYHRGW